jgi:protein TonB
MEANKILQSDVLDILFENRNKDYGAYALRRQYSSHMNLALFITFGIGLIAALSSFLHKPAEVKPTLRGQVVELSNFVMPEQPKEVVEPLKPKEPKPIKTEQFVTPKVEPDEKVKEEQKPPTQDQLENAAIGTQKQDGEAPTGNESPKVESEGTGVVEAPKETREEAPLDRVEVDASFPGGIQAWSKYISREIYRNMDDLQEEGKSGTVLVQFVVDTDGSISDVKIIGCDGYGLSNCIGNETKLVSIALAAIKRGPKWTPAKQRGQIVKAYRRQPITFKLAEE